MMRQVNGAKEIKERDLQQYGNEIYMLTWGITGTQTNNRV
jgi:hypothetical protein